MLICRGPGGDLGWPGRAATDLTGGGGRKDFCEEDVQLTDALLTPLLFPYSHTHTETD